MTHTERGRECSFYFVNHEIHKAILMTMQVINEIIFVIATLALDGIDGETRYDCSLQGRSAVHICK